ncbi:MAG: cobalamin-dependent protein [Kiritimatiellae bacterium]|nr:cobalamin-dependent protein [Kiritimatiellia bacterium]
MKPSPQHVKVLLVNSNRMQPPVAPLALDYIAAALRGAGHEATLADLCLAPDAAYALADALETTPDLVALTFRNTDDCYFASRATFFEVLRNDVALIRRHYSGPVVIGGCGFSVMPAELTEFAGADYGVCGDGEPALLQLLRALAGRTPYSEVPGLVYREGGTWQCNAPSRADLSAFDLAPRDLVDNPVYFKRGGQIGIETKRGCPGRCIYCADPLIKGRIPRLRAPEQIVAEMINLLRQGVDCFHLCDSEFNLPPAHARAVCEGIVTSGLGSRVRWYTYAAPGAFEAELARRMRRAGCVGINFGADSGCDRMLGALGRDYEARALRTTADACREAGLVFMYDLLLGGPGETVESVRETVALMKDIAPDRVGISLGVRVYPGTPLAQQLAARPDPREGIVGTPGGIEPYFYISPALGPDPAGLVRDLIGDDRRFFLPGGGTDQDYNYNDNAVLTDAIARGYRGAYWDILRKLQEGLPPGCD